LSRLVPNRDAGHDPRNTDREKGVSKEWPTILNSLKGLLESDEHFV
jgi:hypothetical protein